MLLCELSESDFSSHPTQGDTRNLVLTIWKREVWGEVGRRSPSQQSFNTAVLEALCSQTACSSAWKHKAGSRGFTYFPESPTMHLLLHRNVISLQCSFTVINRYRTNYCNICSSIIFAIFLEICFKTLSLCSYSTENCSLRSLFAVYTTA